MKNGTNIREKRKGPAFLQAAMIAACLLAWSVPGARGQDARLDLSALDKLAKKASSVKDVNVNRDMLRQIGKSQMNLTGPAGEFKGMAGQLQGVYVRKYEFDKPGEYSHADVESLLKQLQSSGWTPLVRDEDKKTGEISGVYVMNKGEETVGMAVIKVAPQELSVVNIVGPINLANLGGMGGTRGGAKPELQHRPESNPAPQGKTK